MKVRFFADQHNARFVWGWVDGQYVSSDETEIENFKGVGLRWEDVEETPKKKPGRPAKAK